jgi:Protein of unknown function (DUF1326)
MKADYVETCNCDYGCPYNFTGFPTYGYCRALVFYHIREGNYGDNLKLDGLEIIYAASWRKVIHEGNGIMQLFITNKTDEKQRQAIVDIFCFVCYYIQIHNTQLAFEDMWFPLQDYFDRLLDSPVVFPYHSILILPTFEGWLTYCIE